MEASRDLLMRLAHALSLASNGSKVVEAPLEQQSERRTHLLVAPTVTKVSGARACRPPREWQQRRAEAEGHDSGERMAAVSRFAEQTI